MFDHLGKLMAVVGIDDPEPMLTSLRKCGVRIPNPFVCDSAICAPLGATEDSKLERAVFGDSLSPGSLVRNSFETVNPTILPQWYDDMIIILLNSLAV